jgi:hypothetical protein
MIGWLIAVGLLGVVVGLLIGLNSERDPEEMVDYETWRRLTK